MCVTDKATKSHFFQLCHIAHLLHLLTLMTNCKNFHFKTHCLTSSREVLPLKLVDERWRGLVFRIFGFFINFFETFGFTCVNTDYVTVERSNGGGTLLQPHFRFVYIIGCHEQHQHQQRNLSCEFFWFMAIDTKIDAR